MEIIDIHAHAFPDRLAAKAVGNIAKHTGPYRPYADGTVRGLLESMDRAGIAKACVLNVATAPGHAAAIRGWASGLPADRLINIGSVYPCAHNTHKELDAFAATGTKGIKFHPMHQHFAIDEAKMFPVYEQIAALGMFVIFHAGNDIVFPGNTQCSPDKIARIAEMFPKLRIVAAHFGGWQDWHAAREQLCGTDVFIDTSFIHEVPPEVAKDFFSRHDGNRLLFGSDSPWCDQKVQVDFIMHSPLLTDNQRENIFQNNALQLLF
jgi:hypothetical protein